MMKSETINDLAQALSKAQSEMESAKKDAANPHFRSSYATLASVWDAIRGPLSKHGLSVVQTIEQSEHSAHLTTTLLHASGQWLSSTMPLLISKQDMQGLGSAITYARRYSLAAICGIAQDDDDANSATGKPTAPIQAQPRIQDRNESAPLQRTQASALNQRFAR